MKGIVWQCLQFGISEMHGLTYLLSLPLIWYENEALRKSHFKYKDEVFDHFYHTTPLPDYVLE